MPPDSTLKVIRVENMIDLCDLQQRLRWSQADTAKWRQQAEIHAATIYELNRQLVVVRSERNALGCEPRALRARHRPWWRRVVGR